MSLAFLLLIFFAFIWVMILQSKSRPKRPAHRKPRRYQTSRKKSVTFAELYSNQLNLQAQEQTRLEQLSQRSQLGGVSSKLSENQEKLKLINQNPENDKTGSRIKKAQDFYTSIFDIFDKGRPQVGPLHNYKNEERIYHAAYEGLSSGPVFTEEYLYQFLQLTDAELESLTESHKYVVDNLPETYPQGLYKGNGIVYVGGGKFNWLLLLSIKSLRSVGSELPVEVLIPTIEEYEVDLCGRVFPLLDARCILIAKELGNKISSKNKFYGYQYKSFLLITSSFENVLLLDSDNIPIYAPDHLFDSNPFKTKGLIVWPDFWKRATSPYFYKIAGREISDKRVRFGYNNYGTFEPNNVNNDELPLHDREGTIPDPTCESGQLMISKKTHSKLLFLALYYNLFGPDYYYPLFSQGSDGEGDKETFLSSAVILGNDFYQVNKFLNAFGYFNLDGDFVGTAMGQYDPVDDFLILNKNLQLVLDDTLPDVDKARLLFVHANLPKLNPWDLKITKKIFDKDGNRVRLYGPGMAKRVGYDFEYLQWKNMRFLLCDLKLTLDTFAEVKQEDLCEEISLQIEYLEDTVKFLETDSIF